MIRELLKHMIDDLLEDAAAFGQSVTFDLGMPDEENSICLYPGALKISQQVPDRSDTQPQPRPIRETFTLGEDEKEWLYPLTKQPVTGSLLATLVTDEYGSEVLLSEGDDFSVDYNFSSLKFFPLIPAAYPEAQKLIVEYAFVGSVTVREFEQEFTLETRADSPAEAERLASLAATVLLTNHDPILEAVNLTPYIYDLKDYQSTHLLSRYHWLGGEAVYPGNDSFGYTLHFRVWGQIRSVRALPDGQYHIIESIRSPGVSKSQTVNIGAQLG